MAAYLPTNGQALQVDPAVGADYFLVSKSNCQGKVLVVNNLIQEDILVPIRVTLGVKGFRNEVCGDLVLIAIVKVDNVRVGVKDWVGVSKPNRVAILVTFARGDTSFDHGTTSWQHDLRGEIFVAHFGCDLCVPVVRVDDMGVVKIRGVKDQVFGIKVSSRCCRSKVSTNGRVEVLAFFEVNGTFQFCVIKMSHCRTADKLTIGL